MENELQMFMSEWDRQTALTIQLLQAIPADAYDFRPDPLGRSIGEMAWHIAETEIYTTTGIAQQSFQFATPPANSKRPRSTQGIVDGFRRIHDEAVARLLPLSSADLSREITYADGTLQTVRQLLWDRMLLHGIHHRGQLTLLCRMAGGVPPGIFGRTREQTPKRVVQPSAELEVAR
jgi:uncharacterized damage-inducible protein DinB